MTDTVLTRRMRPRDPHEEHRAATPLELFFDLIFVVAIASAGAEYHHGLAEGHLDALGGFALVFIAIWWAWMNFTWFASAYDCDDLGYRLAAFVIMGGLLIFASGVANLFEDGQSLPSVVGYAIMRLGMVALWLRAAAGHPERRRTCLAYAAGITLVQLLWIARLAITEDFWLVPTFILGMLLEIAVPPVAERLGGETPYHPHHIAERYSLFTIIVLGEVILSIVTAFTYDHVDGHVIALGLGAMLIVFSLWWIYFEDELAPLFGNRPTAFLAGYGHLLVFASVAAAGAALAAAVDVQTHHAHTTAQFVTWAVAVPLAVYVALLAVLRQVQAGLSRDAAIAAITCLLLLAVPLLGLGMGAAVLALGVVLAGSVAVHLTAFAR